MTSEEQNKKKKESKPNLEDIRLLTVKLRSYEEKTRHIAAARDISIYKAMNSDISANEIAKAIGVKYSTVTRIYSREASRIARGKN